MQNFLKNLNANKSYFGKQSYILLVVWIVIGVMFYLSQRKNTGITK